jgi:hypothetical protein
VGDDACVVDLDVGGDAVEGSVGGATVRMAARGTGVSEVGGWQREREGRGRWLARGWRRRD